MKEMLVEGEVHTDSGDTESDIDVSKMVSRKLKLKRTLKKKKDSDEDGATYEPTPVENEKLKKKGIKKRNAQPKGDLPRRQKA
ncbi:hypothetical protein Hanom_Chr09g00761861 [Helianthus anomalus]